jgi:hypothetical protein
MSGPTNKSPAGQAYLALRKKARDEGRATDELLQLYALEAFVDRLSTSARAGDLVLKGGVLLAAYDVRRPTRDVDLSARNLSNDLGTITAVVENILAEPRADGWQYGAVAAETIRDQDIYSGVRVTVPCTLASARLTFHVDVNVGDVVWPSPAQVELPKLLGGHVRVRGYPLPMVLAEKIVTMVQRGTVNTRWRDFADVYLLARSHDFVAAEVGESMRHVAQHRQTLLMPLSQALIGYSQLGQGRWAAWVRKQRLAERLPTGFSEILACVQAFADPMIAGETVDTWSAHDQVWRASPR